MNSLTFAFLPRRAEQASRGEMTSQVEWTGDHPAMSTEMQLQVLKAMQGHGGTVGPDADSQLQTAVRGIETRLAVA